MHCQISPCKKAFGPVNFIFNYHNNYFMYDLEVFVLDHNSGQLEIQLSVCTKAT